MRKMALLMAALLAASAFGRVGPVSQYGQLQAGKNSSGKGQIYGKCKGITSGNEVAVQGMSLFWSISSDVGAPFWTAEHVNKLVKDQNIQLIRAPMGVDEDWGSGNYFSNEGYYQGLMNTVVQAAIDNDIYVIIDYHSHHAADNVNNAKKFFGTMAQKWGGYDNVIFEIFNEPLQNQSWGSIKTYADEVVKTIRQYSDNLIVVGNRSWDQYPNEAASNPVADSLNNIAYTFHYYAGSHYTYQEGANAVTAMNSGLSVFVTEWGTVDASGDGGYNASNSSTWYSWMKTHKLSGANWSVSNKGESASYYTGSANNPSYSTSGQWVNSNIFANLPKSYTACTSTPTSSSSIASSSSSMPAGYTDYIDDLEDGDGFAYTGGEWYAYTDKADKGASTISNGPGRNDGYNVVISGSTAGNSSKYVAGVTGVKLSQGENPYDPYVALGVALNETQTAYDLSACNEITYKYKGAAHNFKAEDTGVTDYGYHQITKTASGSWTTATIPWDMLAQEAWAKPVTLSKKRIAKFTWEIKGSQPSMNYLYVDDVRCSGLAFKPVPSPASSSSSVKSSSSIASSSSMSSSSVASSSSVKSSSSIAPSSSSVKVQTVFELTSGNADQTVTAGNSIKSIVYSIKNVTKVSVTGLPAGLMGAINKSNTTFTISGTVADSLTDREYTYTIAVTGVDSNTTATGKITVKHKPLSTQFQLTSGNADQTVTAGNSIKSIVYSIKNVTKVGVTGLPAGLMGAINKSNTTFTISGTVADSLTDREYTYTIAVTGVDSNTTATGKITVKHKPVVTVFELTSGNANQTVTAGDSIKPIVYRYENMSRIELSGIPSGLTGTKDDKTKTYTISGTVAGNLTDYVYDYTIMVFGVDNNTSVTGKITVIHSSSSVASSSSAPVSSSSSKPESSSSVVSSSSEPPSSSSEKSSSSVSPSSSSVKSSSSVAESSSSVVPVSSSDVQSSSSIEESSSSEVIIVESSSSEVIIVESSSSVTPQSSSSETSVSSSSETPVSSSSDNMQVVVSGSLTQTVNRGEVFETITFSNVQTSNRDSWNMYFLDFTRTGDVLTVSGTVPDYLQESSFKETLTINGQKYEISLAVTVPASSSSSKPQVSSSSETPKSSSSEGPQVSSSSEIGPTIAKAPAVSRLSLNVAGRTLHVAGAAEVSVDVFDMQGRPISSFARVTGSVSLESLRQGSYIVRVTAGSESLVRRVVIR